MSDLSMYRGDDDDFTITALDATGAAVDLTGTTLIWTVKRSRTDPDSAAVIQKKSSDGGITILTQSGATLGQATINLAAADTSPLTHQTMGYWDLQVVDAAGKVQTLSTGTLMILLDVTVATA